MTHPADRREQNNGIVTRNVTTVTILSDVSYVDFGLHPTNPLIACGSSLNTAVSLAPLSTSNVAQDV